MVLNGLRNGYCSDMQSRLVLDLGNLVQHKTMAQRGVSRPKVTRKTQTPVKRYVGCAGRSCRFGCSRSIKQKPITEKTKVIVNDLSTKPRTLPRPECYSLDKDFLDIPETNCESYVSVTDLIPVNETSRSNSPDSLVSGLSDDSAASEERQNILQSVASYLSIGSKERTDNGSDINIDVSESSPEERSSNDDVFSEISTIIGDEVISESDTFKENDESSPRSSFEPASETPTKSKQGRETVTKSASFITPKSAKVEFKEEVQRFQDNCHCKPHYRLRRMKNFDPTLEKSQTYLHGQNKNFSRANTYLTPARPGLQKLQINYTQTNTENNHLVIFADLIRTSHKRNFLTEEAIKNLERRLQIRRNDPNRATSYYVNKGIKDPVRSKKNKTVRTVAEKDQERRDRIANTTEELKLGYVPTARTIKPVSFDEMQLIRQCSYLRIDPKLQRRESSSDIQEVGSKCFVP